MGEFFGFGGYERPIEGYFSWQHIAFVTCFMVVMVTAAILLGKQNLPFSATLSLLDLLKNMNDTGEAFISHRQVQVIRDFVTSGD